MMFCVSRYESTGVPQEGETFDGLQWGDPSHEEVQLQEPELVPGAGRHLAPGHCRIWTVQ